MTKEQFDRLYVGENVAVHCDTEEKANELLKLADSFGYEWINGKSFLKQNNYYVHLNRTVYYIKDGQYDDLTHVGKEYEIVSYPAHHKFKVGDIVRVLRGESTNSISWTSQMNEMVGKTYKINGVSTKGNYQVDGWWFHEDWLELVKPENQPIQNWLQQMYQRVILGQRLALSEVIRGGKHTMKPIHLKLGTLDTIAFNKKTLKTTLLYRNFTDFETFETTSNKKDFVDFRVGFLLAWLKKHLSNDEFRTLIGQLFYKGKPQITFLRGYALRYFDSLRQMDKFLEAIKNEQDQVNIGGEIIKIVWKG